MPDGGTRRVWATKAGGFYFCAYEICDPVQEAARTRLFAGPGAAEDERQRRLDIETWSGAVFEQFRTRDAAAAYVFLGRDASARGALLAADPELDPTSFA
jgi:hypothetical protein